MIPRNLNFQNFRGIFLHKRSSNRPENRIYTHFRGIRADTHPLKTPKKPRKPYSCSISGYQRHHVPINSNKNTPKALLSTTSGVFAFLMLYIDFRSTCSNVRDRPLQNALSAHPLSTFPQRILYARPIRHSSLCLTPARSAGSPRAFFQSVS